MVLKSTPVQTTRFKIGWISLIILAALMAVNHLGLIFFLNEPVLFIGYAAFNLYALIVILIPFRRLEKWAWWTSWILPIGLALPALSDTNIALFYFGAAAIGALGLFLTGQTFFSNQVGSSFLQVQSGKEQQYDG